MLTPLPFKAQIVMPSQGTIFLPSGFSTLLLLLLLHRGSSQEVPGFLMLYLMYFLYFLPLLLLP